MDGVALSRMETEWLVAWCYGRSQQMPPHVQERLKSLGFIDGEQSHSCRQTLASNDKYQAPTRTVRG